MLHKVQQRVIIILEIENFQVGGNIMKSVAKKTIEERILVLNKFLEKRSSSAFSEELALLLFALSMIEDVSNEKFINEPGSGLAKDWAKRILE
jgi:hypothetical protein